MNFRELLNVAFIAVLAAIGGLAAFIFGMVFDPHIVVLLIAGGVLAGLIPGLTLLKLEGLGERDGR